MFRAALQELRWEGQDMKWLSDLKRFLNGDDLDDMIAEVRRSTQETCDKIDKLLERAQMNHEQEWMIPPKNNKAEGHVR